jgi:hypothetical protein
VTANSNLLGSCFLGKSVHVLELAQKGYRSRESYSPAVDQRQHALPRRIRRNGHSHVRWFGSHSQFAIVVSDIEVKNVFFSMLLVLDGLYTNGTPLPEMFGYVVMLGIDPAWSVGALTTIAFANDEPSHFTSAML